MLNGEKTFQVKMGDHLPLKMSMGIDLDQQKIVPKCFELLLEAFQW